MLVVLAALLAAAEPYKVDASSGNSNFSAVFDAPLGERINAVSSQVSCDLLVDEQGGTASGSCSVPLTSIMVDNEPTKADHFQQWSTNKKVKPKQCAYTAKFDGLKLEGPLEPGKPVRFTGEIPFTVCGRARTDGKGEHVEGSAQLLPAGAMGQTKVIRIRARVEKFDREAYQVGPAFTDGWLARVQQLAPVVSREGAVELSLFARSALPPPPAPAPAALSAKAAKKKK